MRDRRLEELLRDARAHAPAPDADALRRLQETVLARHAAEQAASALTPAARKRHPVSAWIGPLAIAAGLAITAVGAAGWLGQSWTRTAATLTERLPEAPTGGWSLAFAEAFAEQPMLWSSVLLAAALLCVRPVREALLREIR